MKRKLSANDFSFFDAVMQINILENYFESILRLHNRNFILFYEIIEQSKFFLEAASYSKQTYVHTAEMGKLEQL